MNVVLACQGFSDSPASRPLLTPLTALATPFTIYTIRTSPSRCFHRFQYFQIFFPLVTARCRFGRPGRPNFIHLRDPLLKLLVLTFLVAMSFVLFVQIVSEPRLSLDSNGFLLSNSPHISMAGTMSRADTC